jgi:tRNA (guanine-N7-)-methyltransferase
MARWHISFLITFVVVVDSAFSTFCIIVKQTQRVVYLSIQHTLFQYCSEERFAFYAHITATTRTHTMDSKAQLQSIQHPMESPTELVDQQSTENGNNHDMTAIESLNTTNDIEKQKDDKNLTTAATESPTATTTTTTNKRKPPPPITQEGQQPQKKFYRQRAHCNPLSHNDTYTYPVRPWTDVDWRREHFPTLPFNQSAIPTVLDVGCGFGGLLMALGGSASALPVQSETSLATNTESGMPTEHDSTAPAATSTLDSTLWPRGCILGLEIRAKVTEYVRLRIVAARHQHDTHHQCSVMRTNAMKCLPHWFHKASLDKLFFCFPDPHFKRKNHGRRIVARRLLSEYAYLLKPHGRLYCITDVLALHEWHVQELNAHPLFARIIDTNNDPCVRAMHTATEEGHKVQRNHGAMYAAVYERIPNQQAMAACTSDNTYGWWQVPNNESTATPNDVSATAPLDPVTPTATATSN